VGVSNYQDAIRQCEVGERVYIAHDRGNPHDDLALRAETGGGQVLGYVPKSSWVRKAIHEEGRGATCTVGSVGAGPSGHFGIVLNIALSDDDIREGTYRSASAST